MRKQQYYNYYKRIRTTQERRSSQDDKQYIRGKRRKLPSNWDSEKPMRNTKCWKDSRKKKYRVGGRGQEYSLTFAESDLYSYSTKIGIKLWDLEEYFKAHKVPYRIERLYRSAGRYKRSNGANVTWWSHKDIGIQYFLKGKGYGNSVG